MRLDRHSLRSIPAGAVLTAAATLAVVFACAPDAPDGGLPTHPSDVFSVTLEWDAPTEDAMGRPLTDLVGYRLYYTTALPLDGPESKAVEVGPATRYDIADLPAGEYFFGVTALDLSGNESDLSEPLRVEVGR